MVNYYGRVDANPQQGLEPNSTLIIPLVLIRY